MKYIRFQNEKYPAGSYGAVAADGQVEVMSGDLIAGTLQSTGEKLSPAELGKILPPIDPPNIIAIGANYVDHCKECAAEPPKYPLVFVKTTNALAGEGDDVVLPRTNPDEVDYEAELAVVIGKKASYVPEEEAMDYILGYTCANDISSRDVQLKIDTQWARGKSFDTFCPLGPCLVTGITNPSDLHIRMRLNGKEMQNQPVSDMLFSIARIIAHLSAGITMEPGTVILTGTPCGVGMAQNPPRYLRPGDELEVEIDRIGILHNRVAAPTR
ncbi:MAG: fumarylacetoacetate hydrolase family protein [Victivallales bacterium]|nr:fumarylacetoacetate hydrolase family protein [Victivallales bacterium]